MAISLDFAVKHMAPEGDGVIANSCVITLDSLILIL